MHKEDRPSNRKIAAFVLYILCVLFATIFIVSTFIEDGTNDGINSKRHTFSFNGYWPIIVVTGSMEPNIKINSISICKEANIDDIELGDVVAYRYRNELITHRVIDRIEYYNGEIGLVTKGDNNSSEDRFDVTRDMVEGVVVKTWNGAAPIISKYMLGPGEINYMAVVRALIWLVVTIFVIGFGIHWIVGYTSMKKKICKSEDAFDEALNNYIGDIYKLLKCKQKMDSIKNNELNEKTTKINKITNKIAKIIIMREINENAESVKGLLRAVDIAEKIDKCFKKEVNKHE